MQRPVIGTTGRQPVSKSAWSVSWAAIMAGSDEQWDTPGRSGSVGGSNGTGVGFWHTFVWPLLIFAAALPAFGGARPVSRGLAMTLGLIAPADACLHNVSMPNLLVRDLPDDVHAALQRRARRRGQSLQQFLTAELSRLAGRPDPEEVLDRIERRRSGRVGLRQAVADLGQDRERH